MKIFFSNISKSFLIGSMSGEYEANGNWPSDAVELTTAEQDTYWKKNPPEGKELGANSSGRPLWVDIAPALIADRRDAAKKSIDQAAGDARSGYVSRGEFIGEEYSLALRQCQEWRLAGSPALAVPLSISDWAIASGMTDEQAAVDIEQTAQYFETTLLTIRQIRLSGKAAVDSAVDLGTHTDMSDVAQLYIDQLNAMP